MPVWSGLPDKKNPVEGQRGLSHPFVILKTTIYTNISVLFLRGDQTQNFFFNFEAIICLWTHLKWTPPPVPSLWTLLMDPPPTVPFLCTHPVGPPLYPPFGLTQWSPPPTVLFLWTHRVNPPLYPPFGLTQWTPHFTHPLNSPTGPPTIRFLWTHSADQGASLPPAISITWRSWFSGGFSSWKYLC